MLKLKGNGCAGGAAMGAALVKAAYKPAFTMDRAGDPAAETAFFNGKLAALSERMDRLYEKALAEDGEEAAELIETYQMILQDQAFFDGVRGRIQKEGLNCKMALKLALDQCRETFLALDDPYLRQRFEDIEDVCLKLSAALDGREDAEGILEGAALSGPTILVAELLTPADTVKLDKRFLAGFIVERGGPTSHAVILAKTLGIPAIVGAAGACAAIPGGAQVMMDGGSGEIIVEGDAGERARFQRAMAAHAAEQAKYAREPAGPAYTLDGVQIEIAANSGDGETAAMLSPALCDGIGLYRTEFLYMAHADYPDEEAQFQAYRAAAERMGGKPVVIRTLDIGGDKALGYMGLPQEDNPFLGYRAIRVCLDRPAMFQAQLRAILRASAFGSIKLMFPKIVSQEELDQSAALLSECKGQLRQEGKPFDENLAVGIMVETPAAVLMADRLAELVDFMSIGTNDLTQYITAADRGNASVQGVYDPFHPAVLRAIYQVGQAAQARGIGLGVCGETASMAEMVPFLLGAGVTELSVAPGALGKARYLVRRLSAADCRRAAEGIVRQCATAQAARERLSGLLAQIG